MIQFDRTLQYQFALFFPEEQPYDLGAVERIGSLVGATSGGPTLGLKLGPSQQEQAFVSGTTLVPVPVVSWRAGSGVWRLTWTPARLDLFFDARGYAEIVEQEVPTLDLTVQRVVKNLASVKGSLGFSISRVALIVTGTAANVANQRPADIVARTFFNAEIQRLSDMGQVLENSARVNYTLQWKPAGRSAIALNGIETSVASWTLRDGREETLLTCQFDVNTTPREVLDLSSEEIVSFFLYAKDWIVARLDRL